IVEPLLPAGMLALLSGKDKRGKTLLAQEIVRSVLTGAALFGRFPVRQGPVVGAFLDDPLNMTLERLSTLGVRNDRGLFLVDPLPYQGEPFGLLAAMKERMREVGAVLGVVDALYLLSPTTADAGNDASRMTPIMLELDHLAVDTGASGLVITHDNKSGADV